MQRDRILVLWIMVCNSLWTESKDPKSYGISGFMGYEGVCSVSIVAADAWERHCYGLRRYESLSASTSSSQQLTFILFWWSLFETILNPRTSPTHSVMSSSSGVSIPVSVPLNYGIASSTPHSGKYVPENIMVDKPQDQSSRWSGAFQGNADQWILLRLESLAVLSTFMVRSPFMFTI